MASTRIPDVKAALVTAIANALKGKGPEGADVLVTAETESTRSSEYVYVGRARAPERDWHGISNRKQPRMLEQIEIELEIFCILGTKSSLTSEARAWELFTFAEGAIRDEMHLLLGGTNPIRETRVSELDSMPLQVDNKRAFQVRAKVASVALI